jgi:hypothetical protein
VREEKCTSLSLEATLKVVCEGLPISAAQFKSALIPEDLADIENGDIPVETLRAYAERMAERLKPTNPSGLDKKPVQCAGCSHFERIDHTHLGQCKAGAPPALCGFFWDVDKRWCERFEQVTNLNEEWPA